MLLNLQNPIIKSAPTTVDTLKYSINKLQTTVDSLQKVVLKTEIGTGFFSDAISTNLYMFASIIGLAALISWAFIGRMLLYHKHLVSKESNLLIKNTVDNIDKRIHDLETQQKTTEYNTCRTMFNINESRGQHASAFVWSVSAINAILDILDSSDDQNVVDNYLGQLHSWLDISVVKTQEIEISDDHIIERIDDLDMVFNRVKLMENEKVLEKITAISKSIYHIAYTIPQPPENLMEDV